MTWPRRAWPRRRGTRPSPRRARSRAGSRRYSGPWRRTSRSLRGNLQMESFEPHAQLLQRRVEPALDRAQRNLERVGYLLKRQILELFHHDHLAQLRRERGHGAPDGLRPLRGFGRARRAAALGRRQETLARRLDLVLDPGLGPHARAPLPRDALVDRDAVQPRGDFRLAAEALQVAVGRNEGLLRGVARLLVCAEDAVSQGVNLPLPAAHHFAEGLTVSGLRA